MEGKVELEVLNPEGKIVKKGKTLAPRLETLEGKKIGLVWNGKPNGDGNDQREGQGQCKLGRSDS